MPLIVVAQGRSPGGTSNGKNVDSRQTASQPATVPLLGSLCVFDLPATVIIILYTV